MATIAQYKNHYPNLTDKEVRLMHAARIAAQYSVYNLSHVRTVALAPLMHTVAPSNEQLRVATALLASSKTSTYKEDVLHYPRMNADAHLLVPPTAPHVDVPGVQVQGCEWAVCRRVGYHSDDVDCDHQAYAFWCIKSTEPMTLMLGGNAYPMQDGQLAIFDARVPHALLAGSANATMVGIISTVELTPELRERMGIAWRRANAVSLDTLALMDRVEVDIGTGRFSAPGM